MKTRRFWKNIEASLWLASRTPETPLCADGDWSDGVMQAVREIGSLSAPAQPAVALWRPALALAAGLLLLAVWYAVTEQQARALSDDLFWNDPAGITVASLLQEP